MLSAALVAVVHHAAAFSLVSALVAERLLLTPRPDIVTARRLRRLDLLYGASAGLLLAAGLLRVFVFEKGAAFYLGNPYFLAKFAIFASVGLLSLYPTVVFLSWRKEMSAGRAPVLAPQRARIVAMLMDLQLALLAGILFCAAFMAKGLS